MLRAITLSFEFAVNGDGESALRIFSEIEEGNIIPDDVNLIAIFDSIQPFWDGNTWFEGRSGGLERFTYWFM
ncbi:hypothetical protein MLD38_004335 [Melastoma candidum]|nr:hypothetical protein MLD38_004335 [Melastoma candidum]